MAHIERRLQELGLELPAPMNLGPLPFELVRLAGDRAILSGHLPLAADGALAPPLGKVGADVNVDEAYQAARRVGLALIASLKQALEDLDRVRGFLRLFGMVNAAPGFDRLPAVINGCSHLILEVFGPQVGAHARSAVGLAELPFGAPVEVEGEVLIAP